MTTKTSEKPEGSQQVVKTMICYCPELRLYHYLRSDGDEFLFTEDQLVASIEAYQAQGQTRDARFMADLTAWGRQFPHKIVTFNSDGTFLVADPKVVADPKSAGGTKDEKSPPKPSRK